MSRFLNKLEDVIDLKLTSYGKHLLGIGKFKPTHYAFFDDNIIYDVAYAGGTEVQNETNKRIQEDTQYIEGYTLFQDLEKNINRDGIDHINFFSVDIEPSLQIPRKDIFKFDQAIGDAYLQGQTQNAPAWKFVSLQNPILSSSFMDKQNNSRVPQIHITASYELKTADAETYYGENFNSIEPRKFELVSETFIDNKVIYLKSNDPLIYLEEINTELLVNNFDVEVFEFIDTTDGEEFQHIRRKYFDRQEPQIVDGIMNHAKHSEQSTAYGNLGETGDFVLGYGEDKLSTSAIKYYFDLVFDDMIREEVACKASEQFNKDSFYVDIDFECLFAADDDVFYDIYGSAVEAEICLD